MRAGLPLADPLLARMDQAIGFDWPAFFRLVDGSEPAARLLAYGYSSFAYQLLFLPTLLCLARLPGRAYRLVLGYLILCTISSAIGIFFPADGAYVFYGVETSSLQHINGKFGHLFLESFHGVREGGAFSLGMNNVAGILTFPSVHAGVAALCAWAAWPSRWLRWPFLALNVVMSVSALTHGAHYLVDILAGFAVAALTVALVHRAERVAATYQKHALPAAIPLPG
jgi:membrane-associated phospholipid phosphatase